MNLNLLVDGIMGSATRNAIRDFQRREGLAVDGIVGPDTKKALVAARRRLRPAPADSTTNGADTGEPAQEPNQESEEQYIGSSFDWRSAASEGELDRASSAYVRWVQQGLNKILGLRLAVDGINGPKTRSAVRSFQSRQRLAVDGIVGPNTERALIAVGAGRPPSTGATSGTPTPRPRPTGSRSALRNNIVEVVNREWQRWQKGRTKESDPQIRKVLEDYWRSGAGWLPDDPAWWSKYPWSAAFVSWVMRKAGAGSDFRYSAAHADYVAAARDNRLAKNSNPFKAYRINEVAPKPGDLVCKRRQDGVTYDNVRRGHLTHCDVVTAIEGNKLVTIGGNVSDSVKATPVKIDAQGRVTDSRYFAVVKVGSGGS